jgi:nucleotide-binding universal stress UspA family protein
MASRTLLCYDGSDDAAHAIRAAGPVLGSGSALVASVWRPVTADHLAASVPGLGGPLRGAVDELDDIARDKALERAQEGCAIAREAGFDAEPLQVEARGAIWAALIHAGEDQGADAIVVGRRGLSGVASAVLGSVSTGILNHAEVPVLVVPRPAGA